MFNPSAPATQATLALCTEATSGTVFGQVARCYYSTDVLYSGVVGAGTDREFDFHAYPGALWGKEADPGSISNHLRCYLSAGWNCGGNWSGNPLSVRCVVALDK